MAKKHLKEAYTSWRAYIAEFFGTFVFVFVSLGAILSGIFFGEIGVLGIAIASGFIYAAMVFATVHVSGGHINPAITLSLWFTHKISTLVALLYVVSQIAAGFAAAGLLLLIFGTRALDFSLGAQVSGGGISLQGAIIVETVLATILVYTFYSTMVDRRGPVSFGPLALGFVVCASFLIGGSLSGAVLNPSKVLGASVISGTYDNLPAWIVGPLVGSVFGIVYEFAFLKKKAKK